MFDARVCACARLKQHRGRAEQIDERNPDAAIVAQTRIIRPRSSAQRMSTLVSRADRLAARSGTGRAPQSVASNLLNFQHTYPTENVILDELIAYFGPRHI